VTQVVALIPARAGSKGVPNKNVRMLGGHSLLAWSIAACLKSKKIDRVIVSTDSADYAQLAKDLGAEVPFLRPPEISGDRSTDYDFVVHALDWLAKEGHEPDFLVHIRPTTPFRDPGLIDAAVESFVRASQGTALRSVHEMSESAYKTFEIAPAGQLKRLGSDDTALDSANNARQQFPNTYVANGYVDVLSSAFVRQTGLLHGDHVLPFITPTVVEVDTEDDFAHLEYQLARAPIITSKLFS
jgi:CMP-N,N'-diacetyllegionaminic acid synthase